MTPDLCFQLSKLPDHPLYVVSVRSVHRTLKEVHELEDIGLNDDPRENGVVQVISEALNTRWNYDDEVALRRAGGNEPWLDIQLWAHDFLASSILGIEIDCPGLNKTH